MTPPPPPATSSSPITPPLTPTMKPSGSARSPSPADAADAKNALLPLLPLWNSLSQTQLAGLVVRTDKALDARFPQYATVRNRLHQEGSDRLVQLHSATKPYVEVAKPYVGQVTTKVVETRDAVVEKRNALVQKRNALVASVNGKKDELLHTVTDKKDALVSTISSTRSAFVSTIADKKDVLVSGVSGRVEPIVSPIVSTVSEKKDAAMTFFLDKRNQVTHVVLDTIHSASDAVHQRQTSVYQVAEPYLLLAQDALAPYIHTVNDKIHDRREQLDSVKQSAVDNASNLYRYVNVSVAQPASQQALSAWNTLSAHAQQMKLILIHQYEQASDISSSSVLRNLPLLASHPTAVKLTNTTVATAAQLYHQYQPVRTTVGTVAQAASVVKTRLPAVVTARVWPVATLLDFVAAVPDHLAHALPAAAESDESSDRPIINTAAPAHTDLKTDVSYADAAAASPAPDADVVVYEQK
ncbi:hypothetical protein RI367_008002 [Sorochytrium milnesiophthora]